MALRFNDLYAAIAAVEIETGETPVMIRAAPDVCAKLHSDLLADHGPADSRRGDGRAFVLGLWVRSDSRLPPGVWRLTDEHEGLLYDCRAGKRPAGWGV